MTISVIMAANLFAQQIPLQKKYVPSADKKWMMLGVNRVHVQDFSILEQYSADTCNCGESRELLNRGNVSVGISIYNNFAKRWAFSGDFGLSYGSIKKSAPVSNEKPSWFSSVRMDMYYHLTGNHLQLQPYLYSGIHFVQLRNPSPITVPVGVGLRYMVFNDNGMVTAQAGYGIGAANNIKNSLVYSWGLYVNMGRKKRTPGSFVDPTSEVCPNPLVDTDCDGVVDALDKCVVIPGPVSNEGCPLTDQDQDGVLDKADSCIDVAGPASNNGCPLSDRDKDGIADANDNCPDAAGPLTNGGCPIMDRDQDGIPDLEDRCPDVAGQVTNGGCPPEELKKAVISDTVQFIVYFDFDRYNITRDGSAVLKDVVNFLKKNNNYSILLIGHTDLDGNVEYNNTLSQNRVRTTKNYLINYGIRAERVFTNSFGKSKPVTTTYEKTEAWKNRRVEVFLIKQ